MAFAGAFLQGEVQSTTHTYVDIVAFVDFFRVGIRGTDKITYTDIRVMKNPGAHETAWYFDTIDSIGSCNTRMEIRYNKIDVKVNLFITSIKSGATQAGAGAAV